jgi:GntR family transcriptional regulator
MFLRIEKGSSTPISRQIYEQIAALCTSGSLRAEDRLPSVRQLAQELTVNPNTVLRVYERLTADGLLVMRHGEGTFVAGNATRRRLEKQRRQFLDELKLVVRRGLMLDLAPAELHDLLDDAIGAASDSPPAGAGKPAVPQVASTRG